MTTSNDGRKAQKAAFQATRKALNEYHYAVRKADRDTTRYPAEKTRAQADAKAKAEQAINAAKGQFASGMKADRAARAQWEDRPSGEDLQRRAYWLASAQAELSGASMNEAVGRIENLISQGATAQAAEYAKAARTVGDSPDLQRLTRTTQPKGQRDARAWAAGLDAFEQVAMTDGWFDEHVGKLLNQAGTIHPDERNGKPSTYDDRAINLLMERAEESSVQAYEGSLSGNQGADSNGDA